MARMIGDVKWHQDCKYGCCVGRIDKGSVRSMEERQWRYEYLNDFSHPIGQMCYDPVTGFYGCPECDPDRWDEYDETELEGIEGVTLER